MLSPEQIELLNEYGEFYDMCRNMNNRSNAANRRKRNSHNGSKKGKLKTIPSCV